MIDRSRQALLAPLTKLSMLLGAAMLAGLGYSQTATNPPSPHPVDVDGVATPGSQEFTGTQSSKFMLGSIYSAWPADIPDSQLTCVIAQDAAERGNSAYALFGLVKFGARTEAFADDELAAVIKLGKIRLAGSEYNNAQIKVFYPNRTEVSADNFFLANDGALYGIKAAVGAPTATGTRLEFKLPLHVPSKFGKPFPNNGQEGVYSVAWTNQSWRVQVDMNGIGENLHDAAVDTMNILKGGDVRLDSQADSRIDIDFKPGNQGGDLGNGANGVAKVGIKGSAVVDINWIDRNSLRLYDPAVNTFLNPKRNQYQYTDFNGDGYLDLIVFFDTRAGWSVPGSRTINVKGFTLAGAIQGEVGTRSLFGTSTATIK